MWVDAHCHLGLFAGVDAVLARSRAAGVGGWVQGGVDPEDWARQRRLQERYPELVTAFGLHPWWVSAASEAQVDAGLEALAAQVDDAAAVGELGLDRAVRGLDAAAYRRQRRACARQLQLAAARGKPVVAHVVRAHEDFLRLVSENGGAPAGGIVHAFSGSADVAAAYVKSGFFLSVSGVVARPGFGKLKRALPTIPRARLLIETDAPDGAAEPAELPRVAAAIGAILGAKGEELLNASAEALRTLFAKGA